jgi:UDP-glucose 4-epimerase
MMALDGGRIVVTGGAGFIGSALCLALDQAGAAVVAFDDLSRGRQEFLPSGVTLVRGDIRDGESLAQLLRDVAPLAVVHLAAMHFIPECIARPDATRAVNIEGTRRVLGACRQAGVPHVVFASSAAVYAPYATACSEDATLGPLEVYGESKLAGEQLVQEFCATTGAAGTVLRLFNAVGPRETNPHVIPHIVESLRTGDTVVLGNVTPRRDYIDTRDVAGAILATLRSPSGFRVFNVGTGIACSVAEIVEIFASLLGRPLSIQQEPDRFRPSERMTLLADIARIRRATGWAPAIPLADALQQLVAVYGLQSGAPLIG